MNTAFLTIDDFSSKNTPAIVDYLKEQGIKIILFAEGRKVEQFYEEAKYALKNGMQIAVWSVCTVRSVFRMEIRVVQTKKLCKST